MKIITIAWTCAGCKQSGSIEMAQQTTLLNGLLRLQDAHEAAGEVARSRTGADPCPNTDMSIPGWFKPKDVRKAPNLTVRFSASADPYASPRPAPHKKRPAVNWDPEAGDPPEDPRR
jgi:hypothetical protein